MLERIETLRANTTPSAVPYKAETEALLGGVQESLKPAVSVSQAFQIYLDKIAFSEIAQKSEKQRY